MDLKEAKHKVLRAINNEGDQNSEHVIVEEGIIETAFAWYIPFRNMNPQEGFWGGAYNGFIVGKAHGDLHQPGSAFSIEKWLEAYELGILGGPYDLIITKINNNQAAREYLRKLHLTFHKPEIENGTTWKIPKDFTEKMIDERLANLPCKFLNQNFTFNIETFKDIKASKSFEYVLVKNDTAKSNEIGEKIE